jgi:uncharacterized membrane protein
VYRTAAILLGIGFGGLIDSIVFHRVLQLHMMVSAVVPPTTVQGMHTNVRWDGIIDAVCFAVALAGAISVYRAALNRMPVPAPREFAGGMLMGWGGFNFVEGLIAHQILGLHHVIDGPSPLISDLLFLAVGGVALFWVGRLLVRPRRDWMSRRPRRRLTPW